MVSARAGMSRSATARPVVAFFRDPTTVKAPRESKAPQEPPLLDEPRVAAFMSELSTAHKTKLHKLVTAETRRLGYSQVREGGTIWEKAQRRVVSNLVAHEVDLDEIYFEEPEGGDRERKNGG